jgi:hypothetical protein
MKRGMTPLVVCVAAVVLIYWISGHTYWDDVEVPALPKGEALTNPFYATERFAEALGARTTHDRAFTTPPSDAVLVLSNWNWSVSDRRRGAIEHWVESGGRLLVDRSLMGGTPEFEQWSGIFRSPRKADRSEPMLPERCDRFREQRENAAAPPSDTRLYWICDVDALSTLRTTKSAAWSLTGSIGIQAMRVEIGKGSVAVVNASPFRDQRVLNADHGWLFVAATQLVKGDEVHFLSEEDRPSLVGLIWLFGKPLVVLILVLVAFVLWRDSVRLGPLAASPTRARRSLAEQIRGIGQFTVRCGNGEALHAASARALEEAAARRISGYRQLTARERSARIAELTGFDRDGVNAAIHHPGLRQSSELRNTIEMLETLRRTLLRTRPQHGTS